MTQQPADSERRVIADFVDIEKRKKRFRACEVAAQEASEDFVEETHCPEETAFLNTSDNTYDADTVAEAWAESAESAERFLCLPDKDNITLIDVKPHRIVDMKEADAFCLKTESEEQVFETITAQRLVETASAENITMRHEVCCVKIAISILCTPLCSVERLGMFLIHIPETPGLRCTDNRHTPIRNVCIGGEIC